MQILRLLPLFLALLFALASGCNDGYDLEDLAPVEEPTTNVLADEVSEDETVIQMNYAYEFKVPTASDTETRQLLLTEHPAWTQEGFAQNFGDAVLLTYTGEELLEGEIENQRRYYRQGDLLVQTYQNYDTRSYYDEQRTNVTKTKVNARQDGDNYTIQLDLNGYSFADNQFEFSGQVERIDPLAFYSTAAEFTGAATNSYTLQGEEHTFSNAYLESDRYGNSRIIFSEEPVHNDEGRLVGKSNVILFDLRLPAGMPTTATLPTFGSGSSNNFIGRFRTSGSSGAYCVDMDYTAGTMVEDEVTRRPTLIVSFEDGTVRAEFSEMNVWGEEMTGSYEGKYMVVE